MSLLNYIIWSVHPEILPSVSWFPPRWYGLLFALSFIFGMQLMTYMYKKEGKPVKDVDSLLIYSIFAVVLGARLGHMFFYQPMETLKDPLSILYIWNGGLASHGAAIGIITGMYLYSNYDINLNPSSFKWKKRKKEGQSFLYVMDRVVITVALAGCLIRLGNFVNSEIIGKPTDSDYGVVFAFTTKNAIKEGFNEGIVKDVEFKKGDANTSADNQYVPIQIDVTFKRGLEKPDIEERIKYIKNRVFTRLDVRPHIAQKSFEDFNYEIQTENSDGPVAKLYVNGISRHPAQLYESATSLLIFVILFLIWYKHRVKTQEGLLFSLMLILLFTFRFIHEFFKENQEAFENNMSLNMGQWLSIPLAILGIILLFNLKKFNKPKST